MCEHQEARQPIVCPIAQTTAIDRWIMAESAERWSSLTEPVFLRIMPFEIFRNARISVRVFSPDFHGIRI